MRGGVGLASSGTSAQSFTSLQLILLVALEIARADRALRPLRSLGESLTEMGAVRTFIAGPFLDELSLSFDAVLTKRFIPSAGSQRRRRDPSALPTTFVTPGHHPRPPAATSKIATLRRRRTGPEEVSASITTSPQSPAQLRQEGTTHLTR